MHKFEICRSNTIYRARRPSCATGADLKLEMFLFAQVEISRIFQTAESSWSGQMRRIPCLIVDVLIDGIFELNERYNCGGCDYREILLKIESNALMSWMLAR